MKTKKLPKGRFLKANEIIKKGDLVVYNDTNFYKTSSVNCRALSDNLYYRPFKYKPKYHYLNEGEVIKSSDEYNSFLFGWTKVNGLERYGQVTYCEAKDKYFRRRKHVKVWV
jgi:hypothetical protein